MLLTGGQISTGISSLIVCLFTSILFFSGYILQLRTVHDIQGIIHPPPKSIPTELPDVEARPIKQDRQQVLTDYSGAVINWKRVAYARYVQRYEDVCEAVMLFAELARTSSPAQRVLVYPQAWDERDASQHQENRRLETSLRLLKRAMERYKVLLVSMDLKMEKTGHEEFSYSMTDLLRLTSFDRILYLRPDGLVLNSELLDNLFALPMNTSMVSIMGDETGNSHASLMKPSMSTIQKVAKSKLGASPLDTTTSIVYMGKVSPLLLTQTSSLCQNSTGPEINITQFYDSAAYVRFSDAKIDGPQYDIPNAIHDNAEPKNKAARNLWNSLYERFRVERMSVCGLDIEPVPYVTGNE